MAIDTEAKRRLVLRSYSGITGGVSLPKLLMLTRIRNFLIGMSGGFR